MLGINVPNFVVEEEKSSKPLPNLFPPSSHVDTFVAVGAVIGLAITSIRFAQWMNTPVGRRWDEQHTWFVTVLGVMFTLAWLAVHDPKAAVKAFAFFMVSGTPIVARALSIESANLEAFIEHGKKNDY